MAKNTRFSPEVRQRAVRMVLEGQNDDDSQWAAISSIAPKIGCIPCLSGCVSMNAMQEALMVASPPLNASA